MINNLAKNSAGEKPRIYDRFVKIGLFMSLGLFAGFIAWAFIAKLDEAVTGEGSISSLSGTKTIQHLEGGIIAAVLVEEGDDVEAGQVLVRLDTTQSQARKDQVETQLFTTWARLDRLNAERAGQDRISFRDALQHDDPQVAQIRDIQENLFSARRTQSVGQTDILIQRIAQLEDQLKGLDAQQISAEGQIAIIQEEIDRYNQVEGLQATDVRARLQRERELVQIEGQIGQIAADIARTNVAIGETRIEVLQVERAFLEAVASELTDAQDRALSLQDELRTLQDVLTRTDIFAPASGAILNMQYSTVGGVIPPGQPILEIVPLGDQLVIEGRIALGDVDNVAEGQQVRITIAGLNQRTTPELDGRVVSVGADAVVDEVTGIPFFPVRIEFLDGQMERLGDQSLRPGMTAQIFILGGKRRPIDYLIQPLQETIQNALKES